MNQIRKSTIPNNYDAIIIGSGIGGLVTASQLSLKGLKVLVLESYKIPGGSGGSFERKGYKFDVGASMIFGFGKRGFTNLLTRAISDVGEDCETVPDPVQLKYHLPKNLKITVNRDYEKFISQLSQIFPHEKKGINKFYGTCWKVFNCLDSMPLLSIEDPAYLAKVFFKSPLSCLGLARWLPVNAGDVAEKFIKDKNLLKFIDIECFCWSVMPAGSTPMINAGMVFSDRHAGGINYPKGGVGVIAQKLVNGLKKYNGDIKYKSKVSKVIIENNKAIGVEISNGEKFYAKTIISNATRWNTFGGEGVKEPLIDKEYTPKSEVNWSKKYLPSPSFLSLHLGINENIIPEDFECHHLILNNWNEMDKEQGVIFISIPSILDKDLAPTGKHIVHAFTPSNFQNWDKLSNKDYLNKKKADANYLISRIENIIPNLSTNIDHIEVGTPKSHRRFLGRHLGSYGPIPSRKLPGLLTMPFNTTDIENFYCVGDSCFPGQGLNAVAFSGYACAHKIGAKLGVNEWKLPD